jgi:hypothetical protein
MHETGIYLFVFLQMMSRLSGQKSAVFSNIAKQPTIPYANKLTWTILW